MTFGLEPVDAGRSFLLARRAADWAGACGRAGSKRDEVIAAKKGVAVL